MGLTFQSFEVGQRPPGRPTSCGLPGLGSGPPELLLLTEPPTPRLSAMTAAPMTIWKCATDTARAAPSSGATAAMRSQTTSRARPAASGSSSSLMGPLTKLASPSTFSKVPPSPLPYPGPLLWPTHLLCSFFLFFKFYLIEVRTLSTRSTLGAHLSVQTSIADQGTVLCRSPCLTETLCPLTHNSPPPPPPALGTHHSTLQFYELGYFRCLM